MTSESTATKTSGPAARSHRPAHTGVAPADDSDPRGMSGATTTLDRQLAAAGLERTPPAEAVTASVQILASVAARYPQLLDQDAPSCSAEFEREAAAPLRAVFERAQAEGAIRDDVPFEQLAASLRGLLAGTLRAARRSGADLDAAGTAVARLFLEAARPQAKRRPSPR